MAHPLGSPKAWQSLASMEKIKSTLPDIGRIFEVESASKPIGGLQPPGDVNIGAAPNSVHAVVGPNGAGTSTLPNWPFDKLIPDTGSVTFDDRSVRGRRPHEINQMGASQYSGGARSSAT